MNIYASWNEAAQEDLVINLGARDKNPSGKLYYGGRRNVHSRVLYEHGN